MMDVYARYNPGSLSDVVASLVSAATTSMNAAFGENPAAYNAFNTHLPGFVNSVSYNTGEPKAYLNYILFDASYTGTPQFGYVSVPISAATRWEKLSMEIPVPAGFNGGHAYIYVTNESNFNVFFDDFLIVHEKSAMALRVTESADYYPFGLLIEGTRYVDESRKVNSYGYQGDYAEFDARTGWNRFALRGNYDSRLGRWQSGDPYKQFASPYLGMGNNGISSVDMDGGLAVPFMQWLFDPNWLMSFNPGAWELIMGSKLLAGVGITASALPAVSGGYAIEFGVSAAGLGLLGKAVQSQAAQSGTQAVFQPPPPRPIQPFDVDVTIRPPAPQKYGGELGDVVREGRAPFGEAATTVLLSLPAANYVIGKLAFSSIGLIMRGFKNGSLLLEASNAAFRASDDIASIVVKQKHLSSAAGSWSKFATSEVGTAQSWIQEALRSPNAIFLDNPNLPNTFQVITNLGKTVGTKGQTSIKVIVGLDGKVITAFPVK